MSDPKKYNAPAEESAPFRMGKTPFDPATGKYLPLVPEPPLIQELTITGECEDGDNADDCLVCEDKYGKTLYVAKPFMLQRTPFDGLLIDNITYEYTTPHARIADDLTTAESQEITPAYIFDGSEKIMAARVYQHTMRVGPRRVRWIDLNTAGRQWMTDIPWDSSSSSSSGIMTLDKEYTFNGNVSWTTIDARDWRGRWIWVNVIDSDTDIDEFADDDVEIWDSVTTPGGAYAKQSTQPHAWFKTLLYTSPGAAQGIIRDIFSPGVLDSGDFYLQMETDGTLEIMVESWTKQFSVRFSILSTSPPPTGETLG